MKLLLIDDHDIVRKGLINLVSTTVICDEIFEACNTGEGIKLLSRHRPDIAVVDINLNGENGIDLIEEARSRKIGTKFIVFTGSTRKGDFERAMALDVEGYIFKHAHVDDILYAIKSVMRGGRFYDATIAQTQIPGADDARSKLLESLTEREIRIFKEIGRGLSNAQIAEELYISENTVKKHITGLLAKLQMARRTEVALSATKVWRRKDEL
ncbi:MAG: response regulator [Cellulosilyticaceae bacterium]